MDVDAALREVERSVQSESRVRLRSALAALSIATAVHGQTVVHVDSRSTNNGDGMSWATAFRDLQDALARASDLRAESPVVKIAGGVYRPDRGTGDRASVFQVASATTLLGGFAGIGAPDPNRLDPAAFVTVLSGDLAHDDMSGFRNRSDNSWQVVRTGAADCALWYLTIRGGARGGQFTFDGAGIEVGIPQAGNVLLIGCRITDCQAVGRGGALVVRPGSSVSAHRCVFEHNAARGGGAIAGGRVSLAQCVIRGNTAERGGAMQILDASSHFQEIPMHGSLLAGNRASFGGAAFDLYGTRLFASWCTIVDNVSANGTLIEGDGGEFVLNNSIIWNPGYPSPALRLADPQSLSYFDFDRSLIPWTAAELGRPSIQFWNRGVLNSDPRFALPAGPDGDVSTTDDNDYSPAAGSPAIDFAWFDLPLDAFDEDGDGDTGEFLPFDLSDRPRIHNDPGTRDQWDAVDLGAFEFQGTSCQADYDRSGIAAVGDVFTFLVDWFASSPNADVNRQGGTDLQDIFDFLAAYFSGCA